MSKLNIIRSGYRSTFLPSVNRSFVVAVSKLKRPDDLVSQGGIGEYWNYAGLRHMCCAYLEAELTGPSMKA